MIVALWMLTAAVMLAVFELWRLHGRLDRMLEVHAKHLAKIRELLVVQHRRDDRVAKILSIMCGLWPTANDAVLRNWAATVESQQHEDKVNKRTGGG